MTNQRLNMSEYGYLFERYSVDFEDSIAQNISYTRYDSTNKVIERKKTNKASKYTGKIFEKTVFALQDKNIYGPTMYRFGDDDKEPDIVTIINGSSDYDFKYICRSEIYYKCIKGLESIPRSSISAIYPTSMTEEYADMGFNLGDLWSTCYIDYKYNEANTLDVTKIILYVYAITDRDKRYKLGEDIDNRKDFRI